MLKRKLNDISRNCSRAISGRNKRFFSHPVKAGFLQNDIRKAFCCHSERSPAPHGVQGEAKNLDFWLRISSVKNLRESISYKTKILRLTPQNDITTQSLVGEGKGEGVYHNVTK